MKPLSILAAAAVLTTGAAVAVPTPAQARTFLSFGVSTGPGYGYYGPGYGYYGYPAYSGYYGYGYPAYGGYYGGYYGPRYRYRDHWRGDRGWRYDRPRRYRYRY